jgi:hypothetical protein
MFERKGAGRSFMEANVNKLMQLAARANISATSESHPLVAIALFSAIGLLLSLAVIIADQHMPGEWF